MLCCFFFFFKQKTAYELRIGDWSSDVCSSDLSYSLGAARALMPYIVKPMDELMAEHTDWHTLQAHCELFVSFGGVPRKNAQIAVGGTAQHHVRDGLHRLADHGVRFVSISPVRNDLVSGGLVDRKSTRLNSSH